MVVPTPATITWERRGVIHSVGRHAHIALLELAPKDSNGAAVAETAAQATGWSTTQPVSPLPLPRCILKQLA